MLINGIVNAAVNGGTKLFTELFLEGDLKDLKENKTNAKALCQALSDQLLGVHFSLIVHESVVTESYRPLHNNLLETFEQMKKSMQPHVGMVDLTSQPKLGIIPSVDCILGYSK